MKKVVIGILSACLFLSGSLALADGQGELPWCHIPLQSTDGTRIRFDYSGFIDSGRFGSYLVAQPWIQVSGAQLNGSEHVRAVITPHNEPWNEGTSIIDLTWDPTGRRFTGEAPQNITIEMYLNGELLPPDQLLTLSLAVVIDGNWKTDPISGSSNFQLNLNKNPGDCGN